MEAHIAGYTEEAEGRLSENQKIFDTTVSELSEKLASLEAELEQKTENLEGSEAENDGLTGQVSRMEKEHKMAIQSMQAEQRDLLKQHATKGSRVAEEHASAIATQRKELALEAEQAENRLMVLLDHERQEAKEAESKLAGNLEKVTQKVQSQRETIISLETSVTEFTRQNEKLDSEMATWVENNSALQTSLEEQRASTALIEREFKEYKKQHALGSELGALQEAVAGLQAQLTERNKNGKEVK